MDASVAPGKKGRQLLILLKGAAAVQTDSLAGYFKFFLIHCFWHSRALWGEIVVVTSARATSANSLEKSKTCPSSSVTSLASVIAASKVVRLSPLSTTVTMAILSVGPSMLFWVQTSKISL